MKRLTECRVCGQWTARGAKSCPHCGAPKPGRGKVEHGLHQVANALMAVGAALCALGLVYWLVVG